MNKKLRQRVYDKYGGRCAYSGTPLEPDWQVDHREPYCCLGADSIENYMPCQKIINHYKRCFNDKDFKIERLNNLHVRISKLPINPRTEKGTKRKNYLLKIAAYFGITQDKPFSGKFYFEEVENE
jgi:5-methylcytosine-specific restriction endonuclease McrA